MPSKKEKEARIKELQAKCDDYPSTRATIATDINARREAVNVEFEPDRERVRQIDTEREQLGEKINGRLKQIEAENDSDMARIKELDREHIAGLKEKMALESELNTGGSDG